nr:MAG TPA: hypothetical protein [Caudoviricetes sp.]
MKILNINKYFGANLISLFGYIIILFYFHYFFIYSTNISDVNKEIIKQFGEDLTSGIYEGFYFASYFIIFLFLLLFFIIEILIRKKTNYNLYIPKRIAFNKFSSTNILVRHILLIYSFNSIIYNAILYFYHLSC